MKVLFFGAFAIFVALASPSVMADSGLVMIESANGVAATTDKMEKILKSKGITVFTRIDHAAGAKKIGASLRPTQLLIFGNPKMGTPLMASNQSIGIDLPLKALVYQAGNGKTYITYNNPAYLAERHGIGNRQKVFQKMAGALKNIAAAAAKK